MLSEPLAPFGVDEPALLFVGQDGKLRAAMRRLMIGYALLGKRRWLVGRDSEGFVVFRPTVGRVLVLDLPPDFRFSTASRAQLIACARQWRDSVVRLDGPVGHA